MNAIAAFTTLCRRECTRFLRQPSRIISTLATAALFWLFLGTGMAGMTQLNHTQTADQSPGDTTYAAYLVPGIALMVVMFATVFAAIGLIQDRTSGFLRAALVSPAPMPAIAGSKTAVGALLAAAQGSIVLAGVFALHRTTTTAGFAAAAALLLLTAIGVTSVGLAIAWRINSVSGFHGIMNAVLLPAWALSGALFPPSSAAPWMATIMHLNPAHWAHAAIATALNLNTTPATWHAPATAAFAITAFIAAIATMRRRTAR